MDVELLNKDEQPITSERQTENRDEIRKIEPKKQESEKENLPANGKK